MALRAPTIRHHADARKPCSTARNRGRAVRPGPVRASLSAHSLGFSSPGSAASTSGRESASSSWDRPTAPCSARSASVDGGGGPRSDRVRLRWQLERLFAATVTSVESAESIKRRLRTAGGIPIIDGEEADPSPAITRLSILDTSCGAGDGLVWWHPRRPGHMVWRSSVLLGSSYCQALERAFPVSPRVLAGLRRSPLAIDLYCWLTYFFFGFRDARGASRLERVETWEALEARLGADYGREARRARRALDGARNRIPTEITGRRRQLSASLSGSHGASSGTVLSGPWSRSSGSTRRLALNPPRWAFGCVPLPPMSRPEPLADDVRPMGSVHVARQGC